MEDLLLWSDPDNKTLQEQVRRFETLNRWSNKIKEMAGTDKGPWWVPAMLVAAIPAVIFIVPRHIAFVVTVVMGVAALLVILISVAISVSARQQYSRIANGAYGPAMGSHSFEWEMLDTQLERNGQRLEAVVKRGSYSRQLVKYVVAIAEDLRVIRRAGDFSDSTFMAAHDAIEERAYKTAEAIMDAAARSR